MLLLTAQDEADPDVIRNFRGERGVIFLSLVKTLIGQVWILDLQVTLFLKLTLSAGER